MTTSSGASLISAKSRVTLIKINETDQAGVRLVNVIGPDRIKHFHLGKGEAVITATDAPGNVASAICR